MKPHYEPTPEQIERLKAKIRRENEQKTEYVAVGSGMHQVPRTPRYRPHHLHVSEPSVTGASCRDGHSDE